MSKHWKFTIIILLIFLGKLSGFAKDILVTFYHGVSVVTDAYFLSSSISSLLYMAIYSAIPVIVVPLYARLVADEARIRIDRDLSAAVVFFFIVSLCVAIYVFYAASFLVSLFSGDINEQVEGLAVNYLSIMAMTFALSTLVSFFNAIQTVNKVVVPSYAMPVINNMVFCMGLFFFSSADEFDKILILGVLAWFVLVVINYFISRKSFSFEFRKALVFFVDSKFILLVLPAVIAFYVEQINSFVGVYFASKLGVGSISVLAYSNKLNLIFLSVFLVFLTASLFPRIAAVLARNDRAELFGYLMGCIRLVVICSVPAVIYMSFYSVEIVGLLFQRGNFLAGDTVKVASVFSVVLLALPFCLVRDIMNRVFFSFGNTFTPVLLSLFALFINFALSYALYQQHGLVGLAFSVVVSTIFNSFLVIFLVERKMKFYLLVPCLKFLAQCCVCGVAAYFLLSWLHVMFFDYWIVLAIPFGLVYFICLLIFRVGEAQSLTELLRRRLV